jgi:hypothetical protein
MFTRTALFLSILFATRGFAADQKILIPIFYCGAGIGPQWCSQLLVMNNMSQSLRTPGVRWRLDCPFWPDCQSDDIPPGRLADPISENATGIGLLSARAGFILFAPEAEADKLIFRLSIGASQYPIAAGTDVPVARERDFRTSTIIFPFIRLNRFENFARMRLRIYDPDGTDGAQVRVVLDPRGDTVPAQIVTLSVPAEPAGVPRPAFAELDLHTAFPTADAGGMYGAAVKVEPISPIRFWAFITITDNVTNGVTIVTPQ